MSSSTTPSDRPVRLWYVTGTFHGSHIYSKSEGDARRTFHFYYRGESIVDIRGPFWPEPIMQFDPNDTETY